MKETKREIQSDLIRVVAMLFVITLHVPTNLGERHVYWDNLKTIVILTCNGMFFMLSGKYNLRFQREKEHAYRNFYSKKTLSILVPFIIYTIVIYVCNIDIANWNFMVAVKDYMRILIERNATNHLWFMYQLIGMLVSAPFLAILLQSMKASDMKKLLWVALGWNFVSMTLIHDIMGYQFYFTGWFLGGMIIYFILGFCLDKIITTKKEIWIACVLGLAGLVITFIKQSFFENKFSGVHDLSPAYILFTIGMFIFLERVCIIKNRWLKTLIGFFAKHSFGVYVFHFYVIQWLGNRLHFPGVRFEIVSYVLSIMVVFVLSFTMSFVVDTLICTPAKKGILTIGKSQER